MTEQERIQNVSLILAVAFLRRLEMIPDPSWINERGRVEGPW